MGISSVVSALVLSASLTFASFEKNIEATVRHEKTIFTAINKEQHYTPAVIELLQALHDADDVFNANVIAYLHINRDAWLKEDSKKFGQDLANIALHLKEKNGFYKAMKKSPIKKSKQAREMLSTLEKTSKMMEKVIQENIDYAYMYIDAKQSFSMLQAASEVELDAFWFSEDEETDGRTLFVTSSALSSEELEKVFEIEDRLTEALQKIGEHKQKILGELNLPNVDVFDFNAVSKQHFSRVSFL